MDSWLSHMPKGMLLKSDGFASNISDPEDQLTLKKFCAERGIAYSDTGLPVRLDTFTEYGLAFKERMVPELEDKMVVGIDRSSDGFTLRLKEGEQFNAQRVVLAVGITHFEYVPEILSSLGPEFCSHSARHSDVDQFRGRSVVVIGGGSSALDWAGLLHEAGADVQLVARQESLKFHGKPDGKPRSLWRQITQPQSGLGPGWKSRFYADAPGLFHYLPEGFRVKIVRRALGPSGGWFIKDKVIGQVPLLLGQTVQSARTRDGKVQLELRASDGTQREISADHVIAATGYKVDLERLAFLSSAIRARLKNVNGAPILSSSFESSVPGLYFVGVSAAISFGPVMRFAFGADFAARTVAHALAKSPARQPSAVAVARVAATK
jgi:cation diffusion facilitator CzcD-associated flavoprotein CzcO